jgi:hypothetical protein
VISPSTAKNTITKVKFYSGFLQNIDNLLTLANDAATVSAPTALDNTKFYTSNLIGL